MDHAPHRQPLRTGRDGEGEGDQGRRRMPVLRSEYRTHLATSPSAWFLAAVAFGRDAASHRQTASFGVPRRRRCGRCVLGAYRTSCGRDRYAVRRSFRWPRPDSRPDSTSYPLHRPPGSWFFVVASRREISENNATGVGSFGRMTPVPVFSLLISTHARGFPGW
jgi:hypothetical protein